VAHAASFCPPQRASAWHADIDGAFVVMTGQQVGAVTVIGGARDSVRRQQIADVALKHRLPAIEGRGTQGVLVQR